MKQFFSYLLLFLCCLMTVFFGSVFAGFAQEPAIAPDPYADHAASETPPQNVEAVCKNAIG